MRAPPLSVVMLLPGDSDPEQVSNRCRVGLLLEDLAGNFWQFQVGLSAPCVGGVRVLIPSQPLVAMLFKNSLQNDATVKILEPAKDTACIMQCFFSSVK